MPPCNTIINVIHFTVLLGHDTDQSKNNTRLEECHKYLHNVGVAICVQAFHVSDINTKAARQIFTSIGSPWARITLFSLIKWMVAKLVAPTYQFNGGGYCFQFLLDALSQWNLGSIIGNYERLCWNNESSNLNIVMLRHETQLSSSFIHKHLKHRRQHYTTNLDILLPV